MAASGEFRTVLPEVRRPSRNLCAHSTMLKIIHSVRVRLKKALSLLPCLPRALALIWTSCRGLTAARIALLTVQGLLPVATVHLTRILVNYLADAVRAGGAWPDLNPVFLCAAMLAGVLLLAEVLRSLGNWVCAAQSELVRDHITGLIHQKSVAMDLAFYETPDFYDHMHRARADATHRPIALLDNLGGLFQSAVTLAGMAAVLIPYGAWLPIALLASTTPAFYSVLSSAIRHQRWYQKATPDERRGWYYDWLLTAGENAPEVRLFGIGNHFQSLYQHLRKRMRTELLDLKKSQFLSELLATTISLGITGCVVAWMVWRTLRGYLTLGDLALFYQAFNQGHLLLRSLLQNTGQMYANILFLADLFEFLALQPRVVDPPRPDPAPLGLSSGIRFDNVTFRYPGSDRAALDRFGLVVPAGQFAAVVGANGAGKSTLIKLLCRLYDPEKGSIELDHIDLRRFGVGELRRRFSVLFQTPVHYNATVRENIALGDVTADYRSTEIDAALRASGAEKFVADLPKGCENMLGRWFEGGAELSAGEWQRIALARALLRRSPILLLDEPTSAMDPWSEADWLERLRRRLEGRTALLITHRMTTAMCADVIHVMENGRIVESGSHAQLLAKRGRYAESWTRQIEACA